VDRAAADLGIDLRQSFVVGDRWIDVTLARTIGARAILVRTGHGQAEAAAPTDSLSADAVVANLVEAVGWILRALC
jgi:D-glycero-D-manno-heptose 1,7-bisphosphate phosphatase